MLWTDAGPDPGERPEAWPGGSPWQRAQRHARCGRAHGGPGRPRPACRPLAANGAAPSGAAGRRVDRVARGERRVARAAGHAAAGCAAWGRGAWWAPRGRSAWRAPGWW